ncbi:MAG: response regulator [Candidatus Neomarinimicrobiota bacterium]
MNDAHDRSERPVVLVVEDNEANLRYLEFILKKLKLNVLSASNGEEAINAMKNENVDCMLLDINLGPGMSGIMLMEIFRKEKRFEVLPINAITAYYGGGLSKELIKKGFTDYLTKPFTLEQLKDMLTKYFDIND